MISAFTVLQSCEDTFLDVVPDNIATIEEAFKLRNEAERYLFTCYSFLPDNASFSRNVGMLAGNEIWIQSDAARYSSQSHFIALGLQNSGSPLVNVWENFNVGSGNLFEGIRHCNVFIREMQNEDNAPDMREAERLRWIAEVKFLKAYYHYFLMRMYGPIPVLREVIPVAAKDEELELEREPIDSTVDYLVELLDESITNLPPIIGDTENELGRITRPIAAGIKAKLLLMVASPLFNGNQDMIGFNTKDGTALFNTVYDEEKWERAAIATKEAIDLAEANGNQLYVSEDPVVQLDPIVKTKLDIRQAITERFNSEIIWGNTNSQTTELQLFSITPFSFDTNHDQARKVLSPTIASASNFYTKNGVPIEEDNTLNYDDITELRQASVDDRFNIRQGYRTSILNFDREPRFYSYLGFDGAVWYTDQASSNPTRYYIRAKSKDYAGSSDVFFKNVTGYYIKKFVNSKVSINDNGGVSFRSYSWPEMRLADLYLMYAEALNEVASTPDENPEIFQYIDAVRNRAGLEGVKTSWDNFSTNPAKYTTKDGMRKIIQKERSIEMAYEGNNFWDNLRWKTAIEEYNNPITGWNVNGDDDDSYYQVITIRQQRFVSPRDYFWPIGEFTLTQNPSLVQNPGW
ncbi:hypothetical protein GCM10011397_19270 [Wenyingzhuangia marina]|nr:hypothetical protein GCM10011397_19270 [Wenyingzhuangia marina]